jgi:hypothetical protein
VSRLLLIVLAAFFFGIALFGIVDSFRELASGALAKGAVKLGIAALCGLMVAGLYVLTRATTDDEEAAARERAIAAADELATRLDVTRPVVVKFKVTTLLVLSLAGIFLAGMTALFAHEASWAAAALGGAVAALMLIVVLFLFELVHLLGG